MVFQKPYLNIACKRSAQRAIPWWEHTKLSIKLIRVILRQPKESKKGKKKKNQSLPCPVLQEQMSLVWTSLSVQPRQSGREFLGETPHTTNVEGGWGAQCGYIKEYISLGRRMTLSAKGPSGSQYLNSSVAVNSILLHLSTETKLPFWKRKVHVNNTLGTDQDSEKTNASQGRRERKFPVGSCYPWNSPLALPLDREENFLTEPKGRLLTAFPKCRLKEQPDGKACRASKGSGSRRKGGVFLRSFEFLLLPLC